MKTKWSLAATSSLLIVFPQPASTRRAGLSTSKTSWRWTKNCYKYSSLQFSFRKFWGSSKKLTQNVLPFSRPTLKVQSRKFSVPSRTGKCSLVNLWTQTVPLLTWTTVKTVWRHTSGSSSTDSNKKRSKPPDLGSDNIHKKKFVPPPARSVGLYICPKNRINVQSQIQFEIWKKIHRFCFFSSFK